VQAVLAVILTSLLLPLSALAHKMLPIQEAEHSAAVPPLSPTMTILQRKQTVSPASTTPVPPAQLALLVQRACLRPLPERALSVFAHKVSYSIIGLV
jgi:hypothetical protein